MTGRTVTVPDTIDKVFPASPPLLYLMYALDDTKVAGLNFPFTQQEHTYLREDFVKLPVIGGWFGQGQTPNLENVMAVKPDVMLVWHWKRTAFNQPMEDTAETIGLPLLYLYLDTLDDYARAFRYLGEVLDCPERGNMLADYTQRVLNNVRPALQNLPDTERLRVYYAEGPDGLKTECDQSSHAALIEMAGGRNIQHCEASSTYGMETLSIEEVLTKDPDVILARDPGFAIWRNNGALSERFAMIASTPFRVFRSTGSTAPLPSCAFLACNG
jgi:iron complex transport system substrate-binding protein